MDRNNGKDGAKSVTRKIPHQNDFALGVLMPNHNRTNHTTITMVMVMMMMGS